jgi:plastocyanin
MRVKQGMAAVAALAAAAVGFPLAFASARWPAHAASVTDVGAYGNAIYDTKDLSFRPRSVTVRVGDTVRWTNQDRLVPHTVTENHGLFDLAGSYGSTPVNPPGFAPGTSVQRVFEAGTFHYYCRVHPVQMHGVVSVPVTLTVITRTHGRGRHKHHVYYVHVTWASAAEPHGLVFDVERARGGAGFAPWLTGATGTGATFSAGRHRAIWHVRARLRRASDASAASDWSPEAVAVTG